VPPLKGNAGLAEMTVMKLETDQKLQNRSTALRLG
jgi:hypothetical protein